MLPRWHILFGFLFCLALTPFFSLHELLIVFIATVAIDIDHYIIYAINKKDFSLWHAYQFFRNLKRPGKYYFCFFHTLEFFAFIILLSFFSKLAFLIFLGVTLHLLIDLIAMLKAKCKKKIIFFSAIARLKARKNKK